MKNILYHEISKVSNRIGWTLVIADQFLDSVFLDFLRTTNTGEIFCISIEATDGIDQVCEELADNYNNFDTQYPMEKWMENINPLTPSIYFNTIREVEAMKTRVWHLWIEISVLGERLRNILKYISESLN